MACSVSAGDVNVEERALRNADGLEEQRDVVLRSAGGPDTTEVDDTLVLPAEVVEQAPDLGLGRLDWAYPDPWSEAADTLAARVRSAGNQPVWLRGPR
jgi:hypothetical protein